MQNINTGYISGIKKRLTPQIINGKATVTFDTDVIINIFSRVSSDVGNSPRISIGGIYGSTYEVTDANYGVLSIIPYMPLKAGTYTIATSGISIKELIVNVLD